MTMMKRFLSEIFRRLGAVTGILVIIVSMTACELLGGGGEDEGMEIYKTKAWLNKSVVNYNETSLSGGLQGGPQHEFEITITEGTEWASFSSSDSVTKLSGKVGTYGTTFFVYFNRNETTSERSGEVMVKFSNGNSFLLPFSQWGKGDNSDYDRAWGEQPAYTSNVNYIHKTYYTTLSGQTKPVRNYSICYDTEKLVSRWVAYPIHSSYTGGSFNTRTNAWAFDDAVSQQPTSGGSYKDNLRYEITEPAIPQSKQQNIIKGAYGDQQVVRSLNRGHMLPSATRYSTWMTNAQTFYATNMFPQNGTLNSGSWATLEGCARTAACVDTLYCVVGTLFEAGSQVITSRDRKITVPSHCYKLLLRTRSGATRKSIAEITNPNDIIAIGFLWENNYEANKISVANAAVSIAEIERRSGFTFFQHLQPEVAAKVKSECNFEDWRNLFGYK